MNDPALEGVLNLLRQREGDGVSSIEQARARLEAFAMLIAPIAGTRAEPVRLKDVPC